MRDGVLVPSLTTLLYEGVVEFASRLFPKAVSPNVALAAYAAIKYSRRIRSRRGIKHDTQPRICRERGERVPRAHTPVVVVHTPLFEPPLRKKTRRI